VSRLRLTVVHKIVGPTGQTFVEGETDHVCTSIHEKPKRMPSELLIACERYLAT
jgi:acyl-CoA thioesterase FadM